jgi:glycosyltransferase involved in cell wall biosynthesis
MRDAPAPQIDVIVPVRGAGPALQRCASSLARHVDPGRHRVIMVLDGPPDVDTTRAVQVLERARLDLTVLEHRTPCGYVASVNRGIDASDRDVVLLNSDTQVTSGWLEKLGAAAYADPATATVTPFSNNATICSLPMFLAENTIPSGYDLESFAALVEQHAAREYPRIPTGVGACLYIKRRVLTEVGAFSDAFGLGYGEEIDFCLRASARGYHHVLDDATFIFHEGSRSFGRSRQRRVQRAHRLIRRRHPNYLRQVHEFIRRDPIAEVRGRVLAVLPSTRIAGNPSPPDRVLHLVHGWPPWAHGGTELYAYWLAHQQARQRDVAVYSRYTDPDRVLGEALEHLDQGVRVRLIVNNFTQRNPFCRNGFHCRPIARDFGTYLDEVRPAVLHVHHLAGHSASLLSVARRRGIPILYQVQDWWPVCARVNFFDSGHALCSGPAPSKCARCHPMTNLQPGAVANSLLHRARRMWMRAQLANVDAVVMGSQFIADSYRRWRVLPSNTPVHVVPYGVPMHEPRILPRGLTSSRPLRFGYIGALLPHKGVHLCIQAFRELSGGQAELHVWGSSEDRAYVSALESSAADAGHIHFHGAFAETEKAALLRSLDVLLMPSIGLESFGLVAREAMEQGVPVLASRRGALPELLTEGKGGDLFDPADPSDLARHITRVLDDPELLDRWRRSVPPVKSIERHAEEIDGLYQALRTPRRR